MVGEEITIRQATVDDIPDLVQLRRVMFEAMGTNNPAELDAMEKAAGTYFAKAIPCGEFLGWVAIAPEGETVSVCGVVIDQHPPTPGNLSGQIGYVMNIVTAPEYRQQGLARRVTRAALQWLEEQGVQRAALHTTEVGRPLYESLGFEPVPNEMRLSR